MIVCRLANKFDAYYWKPVWNYKLNGANRKTSKHRLNYDTGDHQHNHQQHHRLLT